METRRHKEYPHVIGWTVIGEMSFMLPSLGVIRTLRTSEGRVTHETTNHIIPSSLADLSAPFVRDEMRSYPLAHCLIVVRLHLPA